jgi:transposase
MDDYPAVSPDLNAIEYVWSWMNRFVQRCRLNSQQHLEELVATTWDAIPRYIIRGYITKIQNVCQQIIANHGWDNF